MSNASTILHKRSLVSGVVPAVTSLSAGELAINVADGKLFLKSTSNLVKTFSDDSHIGFILNPVLSGVNPQYGGNTISQSFANVLGGYNNDVSGGGSTTVNGEDNDIAGDYAFIGSGYKNKIAVDGDYSAILGGSNNLISHPNSFAIGSNLSSHSANFTYVNNISARGSIYGQFQINATDITSGTLNTARLPAFNGDITTTINGSVSAKVVALQGSPISTQSPSNGQTLQWNGTAWTPSTIIDNEVRSLTGEWEDTSTIVQTKSAGWDAAYSAAGADISVRALTGYWDSTYTTTQTNSGNWNSVYSSVNTISANWNSVYSSVTSTSANWDSAYSYVAANSVNLTATNIFVTNDLTVTDTVSAKYYQGTLIDWMTLVRGYKTTPTLLATIGTGDVYTYVYSTATTDKTYYRYIATNGSEDSFYGNFTDPTLSNLISTKKIIL